MNGHQPPYQPPPPHPQQPSPYPQQPYQHQQGPYPQQPYQQAPYAPYQQQPFQPQVLPLTPAKLRDLAKQARIVGIVIAVIALAPLVGCIVNCLNAHTTPRSVDVAQLSDAKALPSGTRVQVELKIHRDSVSKNQKNRAATIVDSADVVLLCNPDQSECMSSGPEKRSVVATIVDSSQDGDSPVLRDYVEATMKLGPGKYRILEVYDATQATTQWAVLLGVFVFLALAAVGLLVKARMQVARADREEKLARG